GLAIGVGSSIAVAGDRAGDETRIACGKALRSVAKASQRSRLEVLDEHVRAGQQRLEQRAILSPAQIGHDGLLAAIEPDDIAALAVHGLVVAAREIALRAFEFDHARASIG